MNHTGVLQESKFPVKVPLRKETKGPEPLESKDPGPDVLVSATAGSLNRTPGTAPVQHPCARLEGKKRARSIMAN